MGEIEGETRIPPAGAEEAIREMARRIVETFDPEAIVLFGSHARGSPGPDSDADLLVVMDVPEGSRRKKATEIDVALIGLRLPADVVVVTPEDVRRDRDRVGTLVEPALREGRVLYERPR